MDSNTPAVPEKYKFADPMSRGERIAAWVYLPVHFVIAPLGLGLLLTAVFGGLDPADINTAYYALGVVYVFIFMYGYLRRAFDVLLDNKRRCLSALFTAVIIDILLSWGAQLIFEVAGLDLNSIPNNAAVTDMASESYSTVMAIAVFFAPLVEEPLFRGAVFGSISRLSRFWAYGISAVMFSLYHVWQFAAADPVLLVYGIAYLPVSAALAFAYERSGSIWVPIFMHMGINMTAMMVLV